MTLLPPPAHVVTNKALVDVAGLNAAGNRGAGHSARQGTSKAGSHLVPPYSCCVRAWLKKI